MKYEIRAGPIIISHDKNGQHVKLDNFFWVLTLLQINIVFKYVHGIPNAPERSTLFQKVNAARLEHSNIKILNAYKINKTVIIYSSKYDNKINEILNHEKTYNQNGCNQPLPKEKQWIN